jgi:hypothetical protein
LSRSGQRPTFIRSSFWRSERSMGEKWRDSRLERISMWGVKRMEGMGCCSGVACCGSSRGLLMPGEVGADMVVCPCCSGKMVSSMERTAGGGASGNSGERVLEGGTSVTCTKEVESPAAAGEEATRDSPLTPLTIGTHEFAAVLFSGDVARRCRGGAVFCCWGDERRGGEDEAEGEVGAAFVAVTVGEAGGGGLWLWFPCV